MGLLEELAVRCEAATGADRAIDADIARAMGRSITTFDCSRRNYLSGQWQQEGDTNAPAYTGSIDEAVKLVPDDEEWSVHKVLYDNKGCPAACVNLELPEVLAMTPALALTAASLRARHALALSKGSDT